MHIVAGAAQDRAACGLAARTPGPLAQTGTAQGSGGAPNNVICSTRPQPGEGQSAPSPLEGEPVLSPVEGGWGEGEQAN